MLFRSHAKCNDQRIDDTERCYQMVIDFFEQAGLPVKNERGNRIFPVSDHSSDVIAALQRVLKKDQVEIRLA